MATATIKMIDDNNNEQTVSFDIHPELEWKAVDYFMPCSCCGNIALNATVDIIEDTHMCSKCKASYMKDFERVTDTAEDAFWAVVASHFPEIKTGDFSPMATFKLHMAMLDAIKEWHFNNSQEQEPRIMHDTREDIFKALELNYKQEWELENTGGGVMVAYMLFYSKKDGEARRIGVSSDAICIIDKPFTDEQNEEYGWFFGDNPTAFLNTLEEHANHSATFDFGKIFDDCQVIAKSDAVL